MKSQTTSSLRHYDGACHGDFGSRRDSMNRDLRKTGYVEQALEVDIARGKTTPITVLLIPER